FNEHFSCSFPLPPVRRIIMSYRSVFTCAVLASTLVAFLTLNPRGMPAFSPWSTPVNLGTIINSPSVDAGAAISKNGLSLYFNSDRPGGFGNQDIWVSHRATLDAPWGLPLNLGSVINTDALESVPSFSRDEHWMFFNSNRPGGSGQVDAWASYRTNYMTTSPGP